MKYSDMIAFLEQANTTLTDLKISNDLHFIKNWRTMK